MVLNQVMTRGLVFLLLLFLSTACAEGDSVLYKRSDGLVVSELKASYKGKEIYNAAKDKAKFIQENESADGCSVIVEVYIVPLSLVDNYFSYQYYFGSEAACGHYGNDFAVETIDLSTLERVSLSDLFTEASIVSALKRDSWVLRVLKAGGQAGGW